MPAIGIGATTIGMLALGLADFRTGRFGAPPYVCGAQLLTTSVRCCAGSVWDPPGVPPPPPVEYAYVVHVVRAHGCICSPSGVSFSFVRCCQPS